MMSTQGEQIEEAVLISGSASENEERVANSSTRARRIVALALGLSVVAALFAFASLSSRGQDASLIRYGGGDEVQLNGMMDCGLPSIGRRLEGLDILSNLSVAQVCTVLGKGNYTCNAPTQYGVNCSASITCPSHEQDKINFCCNGMCTQQSNCFPGEAIVDVAGKGLAQISTLQIGDSVLVQKRPGAPRYEPVLGFLHHGNALSGTFLQVSLASGDFRATSNHLVFTEEEGVQVGKPVGELRVGDKLFVGEVTSEVRALAKGFTKSGMFTPLTGSGTVVVDNVLASIYAQTSDLSKFPHAAAHALFFLARAYYAFMPTLPLLAQDEYMHPLAAFLHKQLLLDRVLGK